MPERPEGQGVLPGPVPRQGPAVIPAKALLEGVTIPPGAKKLRRFPLWHRVRSRRLGSQPLPDNRAQAQPPVKADLHKRTDSQQQREGRRGQNRRQLLWGLPRRLPGRRLAAEVPMPFLGRKKGRRTGLLRWQGKILCRPQMRRLPLGQTPRPCSTIRSSGRAERLRLVLPQAERKGKALRRPDRPSKRAGNLRRKGPWKVAPAKMALPPALVNRRQPPAGTTRHNKQLYSVLGNPRQLPAEMIRHSKLPHPALGKSRQFHAEPACHSGLLPPALGRLCPPPAGTANRQSLYFLPPIPGKAPAGMGRERRW